MASSNLALGMREQGLDAKAFFATDSNVRKELTRNPNLTIATAVDNYVARTPSWSSNVSLFRFGVAENLSKEVFEADSIILRWSVGLFGLDPNKLRDKRVIWTFPDQAWLTGACHNSLDCKQFTNGCGNCPAVRRPFKSLVAKKLEEKLSFFNQIEDLHFVVHSEKMLEILSESKAGKERNVQLIHNPISPIFSENYKPRKESKNDRIRIVLVAENIDDPIKGFKDVSRVLTLLIAQGIANVVVVGRFKRSTLSSNPEMQFLGYLESQEILEVFDNSDILLVPSLQESAGNVIAEAASRGVPSVIRNGSGVEEFAISEDFLFVSASEIPPLILGLKNMGLHNIRKSAHDASRKHNYRDVARKYIKLII